VADDPTKTDSQATHEERSTVSAQRHLPLRAWRSFSRLTKWAVATAVAAIVSFFAVQAVSHPSGSGSVSFVIVRRTDPPIAMVVSPKHTGGTNPGSDCENFENWGTDLGGYDAGASAFQLVVQSDSDQAVYISGMRADILKTMPDVTGVVLECPTEGVAPQYQVRLDLDRSPTGDYVTSGSAAAPFGFELQEGETEVFDVEATAQRRSYAWDLEVKALIDGQSKTFIIKNRGAQFLTTGFNNQGPNYSWLGGKWTAFPSGETSPGDSKLS